MQSAVSSPKKVATTKPIAIKSGTKHVVHEGRALPHSAPAYRQPPPPPPLRRPNLASIDPPPMELPPSPAPDAPILSNGTASAKPLTTSADTTKPMVKKASIVRSLMLSSSCPVDVGTWLATTEEEEEDSKEDSKNLASSVSSTSSVSPNSTSPGPSTTTIAPVTTTTKTVGIPVGIAPLDMSKARRKDSSLAEDKRFSVDALSKSPTVFGFMADANKRSPPASGRSTNSSRSTVSYNRLSISKSKPTANPPQDNKEEDPDDLQFAISLDKEDDSYLDDSPAENFAAE